jgi:hypothetical protein
MLRRWGLGIALSLAGHLAAVGGVVAILVLRGSSLGGPVDVEISGMRLDEVHDLPLGPPAGGADPARRRPPPRARHHAPKTAGSGGELASRDHPAPEQAGAADVEDSTEGAPERPSSLRQYGPEGSRVTVLLRLDRLRETPYAAAVDAVLSRLPDRRDLLDGTGLDLYQSFDALLIATPNPLDYTVTFLAARHRLKDAELRAALERGASATNRILTWHAEERRPVAERRARVEHAGASRDDRLVIMPAPGLVVVTPPIYRSMLLGAGRAAAAVTADGGTEGHGVTASGTADGGATGAGDPAGDRQRWGALLRRIDAEDGILPPDAIAMLSAVDIFSARSLQRGLDTGPRAKGASGAGPIGQAGATPPATIFGMDVPKVLTAVIGAHPEPFVDITAEFENEAQARQWESAWPSLHQRLRTNAYVVLTGFSAVLARTELRRSEAVIHIHQTTTEAETLRVLQLIARFGGAPAPSRSPSPVAD